MASSRYWDLRISAGGPLDTADPMKKSSEVIQKAKTIILNYFSWVNNVYIMYTWCLLSMGRFRYVKWPEGRLKPSVWLLLLRDPLLIGGSIVSYGWGSLSTSINQWKWGLKNDCWFASECGSFFGEFGRLLLRNFGAIIAYSFVLINLGGPLTF